MPDLSIIILHWNTPELLKQCLESIYSNAPKCEFEVIVVDNNSDADISDVEKQYSKIRLIRNGYNYGFAVGNNIGYRASSGRYIMPLNPDTVIYPNAIDLLIEELEKDPAVGVASPVSNGKPVKLSDYFFSRLFFDSVFLRPFRRIFGRSVGLMSEPFDVNYFGGTGYICRRSALKDEMIFREKYFLFGEEYQLCCDMAEKGLKIRIVPSAKIEHFASATFNRDPTRFMMASRLGAAINWEIRYDEWGAVRGALSGMELWVEHLTKLIVAKVMLLLIRKGNARLERIAVESKAVVSSLLPLLSNGDKYRSRINNEAAEFFNNGVARPKQMPVGNSVTT